MGAVVNPELAESVIAYESTSFAPKPAQFSDLGLARGFRVYGFMVECLARGFRVYGFMVECFENCPLSHEDPLEKHVLEFLVVPTRTLSPHNPDIYLGRGPHPQFFSPRFHTFPTSQNHKGLGF